MITTIKDYDDQPHSISRRLPRNDLPPTARHKRGSRARHRHRARRQGLLRLARPQTSRRHGLPLIHSTRVHPTHRNRENRRSTHLRTTRPTLPILPRHPRHARRQSPRRSMRTRTRTLRRRHGPFRTILRIPLTRPRRKRRLLP